MIVPEGRYDMVTGSSKPDDVARNDGGTHLWSTDDN
jgi:hypothetical protein